ncbi:hypothetical protein F0562_025029 [Nyssa sinensis]|uniref:Uncharacterized protein n=1 Tax=Nyssa sinensis TaxID=561372 RepID=A0A5J5BEM9_9ASTE|nr:hypothetical protein F0562_025029 [Nyssa sinensis]
MDIVICCSQAIGGKILDTLLNPMSRQIGYLVHYKENVQTLEAELGKLVVEIRAVQQRVNEAQDNAKEIEEKVQNWLTEVDKMKGEVEEFLEGKDRAFRRCFKVRFPDLYSRHRLGREAKKKTEVITRLITDGKFETVSRPKPLPDIGIPHVLDYVHFKSRGRVFEEIIEALRDDTINVIGIYGIGGVGKTTMVEEVREQVKKDKHFDEVTWAVISQNLDVRKTQGQIAGRLSLDLDEAKDEVGRAGLLYNRLTDGRKILIILDDVWEKLNLKEIIGIPSMDSVKGCKILLTSRSREVCVKNNCRDPFLLGDLSEEEAWDLFKKEVGDSVDNAQIQPVAKKVCEQCGRLPLVVRVVGATLKNKNKPAWDDALEQLRNFAPEDIAGIDRKAFSSLEWSYNRLEHEDARSCFLLCSLFPEDANILIDDLARYAMVMGWLKHADTLEKANNRVRQLVEILKYSCLLLGGGLSYEEEAVRMHDIIRDIAIKIASRDEYAYLVKTGGRRWQTGSFERKKAISLTSNEIEELPDISIIMELKKLEILILGGPDIVKVLPLDIRNLTLLRSLDLRNCRNFRGIELDVITSLTRLEELYISAWQDEWEAKAMNSNRKNASIPELNKLTDLTALGIHIPNTTSWLVDHPFDKLNRYKISIGTPFNFIDSLNSLSSCRALKLVDVPIRAGVKILMEKSEVLILHNLKGVKRSFSEEDGEGGFSTDLKYLEIDNCGDRENLWGYKQLLVAMGSFCKLSKLVVKSMHGLKYLFSPSIARGLMQLKELHIRECVRMETIIGNEGEEDEEKVIFHGLKFLLMDKLPRFGSFDLERMTSEGNSTCTATQPLFNHKIAFPVLEYLDIRSLNMKEIWDSQLPKEKSFSQLSTLQVSNCDNLVNIVPSHMLPRLRNLVEIEVESCDSVISVGLNAEEGFVASMPILPQLKQLRLHNLPKLMHYELNQVSYGNCCYPNLMKIVISSCQSLRNVFSLSVAINIVHLEKLKVSSCEKMQEIIATKRGSKETLDKIVFPRLKLMKLERLQNLKSFWSSESQEEERVEKVDLAPFELQSLFNDKIAFPVLEDLRISGLKIIKEIWDSQLLEENSFSQLRTLRILYCRNLVNIVPSHMLPRLRNLVEIEVESCDSVISVGLNAEEGFVASMPILPQLKQLRLHNLPKLMHYELNQVSYGNCCYPNLMKIVISSCQSLRNVFSLSVAINIVHLEELEVSSCEKMKEIIATRRGSKETLDKIVFPRLKLMKLERLQNLKSFWSSESQEEERVEKVDLAPSELQSLFNDKIAFPVLEDLRISGLKIIKEIWDSQLLEENSFSQLRTLRVLYCRNLVNIVPSHMLPRLRNLVEIEVESCDSVISVGLNAEEGFVASMQILPQLKQLRLHNLPKLMHYELNQVSYGNCCYPKLMKIVISSCQSLRNVFSLSVAINIVHLEELEVSSCEKMKEIIATRRGSKETLDKIVFPRLKLMKLERLQNLKSFWSSESQEEERVEKVDLAPFELQYLFNDKIAFPVLEDLRISGLKIIKEIWDSQLQEENSFSQLRTLRILYCRNLVNIVPSHMLPRLRNLVEIEVESCDSVISVGLNAEEGFVASMPILPQLKQLRLHNLPKLMHYELNQVSYGNCCYPNLMKIVISSCQSLRNVFSLSVAINIVHLEELEVSSCEKMQEIIATRRGSKETLDKIVFPRLKLMKLERLQNLKSFWSSESQEEERVEKVDLAPFELQSLFNDKITATILKELIQATHGLGHHFGSFSLYNIVAHNLTLLRE